MRAALIAITLAFVISAPAGAEARIQPMRARDAQPRAVVSAAAAQQNQQPGEVRFSADNEQERDSGVWVDGKYFGYVKELKGDKKVMLPPGEHEISIRSDGYKDLVKKIVVQPGEAQTIDVVMEENPKSIYPGDDAAEFRLDILGHSQRAHTWRNALLCLCSAKAPRWGCA